MNKKIIIKPVDDLTDVELRRLESELNTIGGYDFVIETFPSRTTAYNKQPKLQSEPRRK